MWHCAACGAYPVTSLLKPATHLYTQEYFEQGIIDSPWYSGYLSYDRYRFRLREDFTERVMSHVQPHMRVLDIGCATGTALEAVRDLGVSESCLVGIDVSTYAIEKARKYLPGVTFMCKRIEEAEIHEQFDIIMLWDVLEHVSHPFDVFTKAVSWLAPGGKIVISTPDPTSWIMRCSGWHWSEFRSGEHLCFISHAWCEWAAKKTGIALSLWDRPIKRFTIEHAASRLRAYIPFFPKLNSQMFIRVRALDQQQVVFEKPLA